MRNFIKQEIQARLDATAKNNAPESVPSEAILEYASLFQELDELTPGDNDTGEGRSLDTEIPILGKDAELDDEDDLEATSISFDLQNSLVDDVPKDASAVTDNYEGVKSYEEFYHEALDSVTRFPRESDAAYEARVTEYADSLYNEYCTEAAECGYFGFDKINITDERVPAKLNVNFGAMSEGSSDNFVTKVSAFFATDNSHNITKKQLDSVQLVKMGALKNIGEPLKAYMESNYDVDSETSVWDVCSPKSIIIPKGNNDSFCVVVEYTNEITGKDEFFGWTAPVTDKDENITMESCEKYNMESFVNETHYERRDIVLQEMAIAEENMKERMKRRVRPQRFYQEAIEGLDDSSASTDTGSTDASATTTDDTSDTSTDTAAANADDATATDAAPAEGEKKETAAVNNVSSEIAEKVASDTQSDAMSDDDEITFSDETNPTDNVGVADGGDVDETAVEDEGAPAEGLDDAAANDDADAALAELDDTGASSDEAMDEEGLEEGEGALDTDNVDEMSVNQLLELGKESLKDMKVGDLKDLIAKNDNEAIQEAFILTPKNVNRELDIKLRKCLGILNAADMKAEKLLGKFKIEGHKLNRALSKAAKMTKVYSSDEIAALKKLNSALAELLLSLKKKPENYGTAVKGKIKDFTKEAKTVGAIIEDKLSNGSKDDEEVTQEAFLLSNINDKITKALIPVKADMSDLSEKYQAGQLTRGRLMKKYAAGTGRNVIAERDSFSLMSGNLHVKNLDTALKFLNKALRKNVENSELIEKLADKIDLLTDYIETVIDDSKSVDMKPYIDIIGKTAGEIVELIDQFIGDDSANIAPEEGDTSEINNTSDPTMDSAPTSDDEEAEVEIPDDDEGILEEPEEDTKEDEE